MRCSVRKGENKVTYALSRRHEEYSTLLAFSTSQTTWLEEVCFSYECDSLALQLLSKMLVSPSSNPDYSLYQGVIRCKYKIYVGRKYYIETQDFKGLASITYWRTLRTSWNLQDGIICILLAKHEGIYLQTCKCV